MLFSPGVVYSAVLVLSTNNLHFGLSMVADSHKLCRAANMNNIELLEQFLKNGVDPNCWDSRKRTPLHLAASKGYPEAVG